MKKVIPLQGYHGTASKTRIHSRGAVILFFENPAEQAIETMRALIMKFHSAMPVRKEASSGILELPRLQLQDDNSKCFGGKKPTTNNPKPVDQSIYD